jgi:CBS domain-containing protein
MHTLRHLLSERARRATYLLDARLTAQQAAMYLQQHHIGGAPVLDHGDLVGFCSERDIVFKLVARRRDPDAVHVRDIMSRHLVTATIDDSVEHCESLMRRAHVRHLPILDDGRVVACISLRDTLRTELEDASFEIQWLIDYVRTAGAR